VRGLSGHTQRPFAVAFSPNGKLLATGCFGPILRIWNLAGADPDAWSFLDEDRIRAYGVASLGVSADGKLLAAGSYTGERTLRLWDVSGPVQSELLDLPKGHARGVAFSPTGNLLAFHGEGGAITLWEITAAKARPQRVLVGHPLAGQQGTVRAVAFSPDGRQLASCGQDRKVIIWDMKSGKALR